MGATSTSEIGGASQRLIGPYRLLRPIAEGGMGVVYRAEHHQTGDSVALKVVRMASEGLLASFRREIFALKSIAHPGVVRIVSDGVHHGQPWYAMPLLRGRTFGALIDARHGRTPPPTAHRMLKSDATAESRSNRARLDGCDKTRRSTVESEGVRGNEMRASDREVFRVGHTSTPPDVMQVGETLFPPLDAADISDVLTMVRGLCQPLAFVHGLGVVHRDLKPDNIIIVSDGTPVLVDFGLVQQFGGDRTRDVLEVGGSVLGTPAYMAPEQIRGDLVDARADLYALGCVLYEALTGRVPFDGTAAEVLQMHLSMDPLPPSELAQEVPPEVDDLVMRLLEKQPQSRLGYAADVDRSLAEMGVPVSVGGEAPPGAEAPAATTYLYRPSLAGRRSIVQGLSDVVRVRRGALVLVGGRSGVGKTRLAMELATMAARAGATVVTGQCLDFQEDAAAPLHPFRSLLLSIADRCRSGTSAAAERIVGAHAGVLAPYEPSLVDGDADEPPFLPPEAAKLRLLDALAQVTARFAGTRPLFVVLDDLQWADELSLALLAHLDATYFDAHPVVIVGTYRDDEQTDALVELGGADHVETIALGPLDEGAVREMVGDMLALSDPPAQLVDFLMAESAGNPFFIAEYLRAAIDEGVLRRSDEGVWRVGDSATTAESLRGALPLPGGMRDLVRRRIGRLTPVARAAADVASVLGKDIDGDLLFDERAPIEELRRSHILEEGERGRLRFTHDKLREIIYRSVEEPRRSKLHLAAAQAIAARYADSPELALSYATLAHHFGLGGDRERTIDYLELAGEQALASAAPSEARGFFERALSMADENDARRAGWQRRLGEARYQSGDLHGARDALNRAIDLFGLRPAMGSKRISEMASSLLAIGAQIRSLLGGSAPLSQRPETIARMRESALAAERLSQVYYFLGEQAAAFVAGLESAQFAEGLGPSPELARAYAVVSIAVGFIPLPPLVERYGRKAIAIARQVDDPHAIAFTQFLRGLSHLNAGRHVDARRHFDLAIEVAGRIGDPRIGHEATACQLFAETVSGDLSEAQMTLDVLRAMGERTRAQSTMCWVTRGAGVIAMYLGDAAEAVPLLLRAMDLAREVGEQTSDLEGGLVAECHMMLDDWPEALAVADRTLRICEQVKPTAFSPVVGYWATCEVFLGAWERALEGDAIEPAGVLARKSARACNALDKYARIFGLARPAMHIYRGLAHWLGGSQRRARRSWQRALSLSTELALPLAQARAHYELGRHHELGHRHRRMHLVRARELYERCQSRYWLERAHAQPF